MSVRAIVIAITVAALALITAIPTIFADDTTGASVPSECSKFVSGGPNTNHSAFTRDFQGNVKSSFGSGENVIVDISVNSSVGGTDVNRVKVVWISPAGGTVTVSLLPRGNENSSAWHVDAGLAAGASSGGSGNWTAIVRYETPNNAKGRGVTHHIDVVTFTVTGAGAGFVEFVDLASQGG